MASDQPVCLIEYNVYEYSRVDELLPTGKTEKVLRQTKLISSVDILDVEQVTVTQSMAQGADDFSVVLNNDNGEYTDQFLPFQEIAVYIGFPTDPNDIKKSELALVIVGLIDDAQPEYSKSSGWKMTINGRNYAGVLLDNKVTENFKKISATKVVETVVRKYGLGFKEDIAQKTAVYQKTITTNNPSAVQVMTGRTDANVKLSEQSQSAIDFVNPRAATQAREDDSLFKNKTAWDVIQTMAWMEAITDPEAENRELVSYFDGKTFYFGPRRNVENDQSKVFQLTIGENVESFSFRMSSQFIHTRLRMVTRKMKNKQLMKEPFVVLIPDDLKAPADISAQELGVLTAFQGVYGIRELTILDRESAWGGNIAKLKRVGIAKLKEFTRLAFTGEVKFVFTSASGNAAIRLLNKDRAVSINGVPAAQGLPTSNFEEPQSERFNGIFYIEKCAHNFTKGSGYRVSLSLSSRKPERQQSLTNLTLSPSKIVTKKVTIADETPYDEPLSILSD